MLLQDMDCPEHSNEPGFVEGVNLLNVGATISFLRRNRIYSLSQRIETPYIIQNV